MVAGIPQTEGRADSHYTDNWYTKLVQCARMLVCSQFNENEHGIYVNIIQNLVTKNSNLHSVL